MEAGGTLGRLLAALMCVATLAATGCGGDDSETDADRLDAAVARTIEQGSARATIDYEGPIALHAELDVDFDSEEAAGVYEFESVRGIEPGTEARSYNRGTEPGLLQVPGESDLWLVSSSDPVTQLTSNPVTALSLIADVGENVEKLPGDTYELSYSLEDLGEAAGSPTAVAGEIPFEVRLSSDGVVEDVSFELAAEGGTASGSMRFSEFGEPVRIERPPESRIVTVRELRRRESG